jgi:hypothetical protein
MLRQCDIDRIVFGCGNFGGIGSSPNLRDAGDSEERQSTQRSELGR